jgi:hypothetical protein
MKKATTSPLFAIVALLVFSAAAQAQGGGKAEPLRIEFKPGTTTTTISDTVWDQVEAEYVFTAKKGQHLTIKLASVPRRSAVFDLKAPGDADLGLLYDANYNYSGVLPVSGDYLIIVVRPTSARGKSSYKFTVTIR